MYSMYPVTLERLSDGQIEKSDKEKDIGRSQAFL